jgi:hypothetical protein
MTPNPEKPKRGRPKVTDKEPHSTIVIRLPTTLLNRAKAVADGTVAAFVRKAIEDATRRRERGK